MALHIQENIPLAPLTTLGVGGPARFFAEAGSADDVRRLLARVKRHPVPPHGRVGYAEAAKVYLH